MRGRARRRAHGKALAQQAHVGVFALTVGTVDEHRDIGGPAGNVQGLWRSCMHLVGEHAPFGMFWRQH
jgi:hypothetical protein